MVVGVSEWERADRIGGMAESDVTESMVTTEVAESETGWNIEVEMKSVRGRVQSQRCGMKRERCGAVHDGVERSIQRKDNTISFNVIDVSS